MVIVARAGCAMAFAGLGLGFGLGLCFAPTPPILDGLPLELRSAGLGLRLAPAQPILRRLPPSLLHAFGLGRRGGLLRRSLQPRFDSGLVFLANAFGEDASIAVTFHFKRGAWNVRRGFAVNALRRECAMIDARANVRLLKGCVRGFCPTLTDMQQLIDGRP